jgi:hypothetical protein
MVTMDARLGEFDVVRPWGQLPTAVTSTHKASGQRCPDASSPLAANVAVSALKSGKSTSVPHSAASFGLVFQSLVVKGQTTGG